MTKNYIQYIQALALGLVLAGASTSCSKDDDNSFGQTPSARSDKAVREALATLQGSVYGWEMRLYPSAGLELGGYTAFVAFDKNGAVRVADDKQEDPSAGEVSLYEVNNSNGPTLTFNTYNPSMHRYSEPNVRQHFPSTNVATGAGGDYSYQIMSVSPDSVVLRGIRSRVKAVLTPLKTSNWEPLMKAIQNSVKNNFIPTAQISVGGETISGASMTTRRHLSFSYKGIRYNRPFRYTDTGIEFYEPLVLGGTSVQRLSNKGTTTNPILSDESGNFSISYEHNPAVLLYQAMWQYTPTNSGGRFASAFTQMNRYLNSKYRARVDTDRVYVLSVNGQLQIVAPRFYYTASDYGTARLLLSAEMISDNEIKFTYEHSASLAQTSIAGPLVQYRSSHILASGFSNVGTVEDFVTDADFEGRTFTITAEEGVARPSWIRLVDKNDPSNTLKLNFYDFN